MTNRPSYPTTRPGPGTHAPLQSATLSVVTNDDEAEDVLQEAWVLAYEHLDQFAGRASFATWVTRIAFHEALARNRKSRRWTPLVNSGGEIMADAERRQTTSETPEMQAVRRQLGQMLEAAVDALPETCRSVLVLREVEQLSTIETAECLDLSEEAVKSASTAHALCCARICKDAWSRRSRKPTRSLEAAATE